MREEITVKLEDLKKYVAFLKSKSDVRLTELERDQVLLAAVERYLQVALECSLEIGEMIISNEGLRKPESYRDVIRILGEVEVLPLKFAEKFEPAAGVRNILVHHYAEVDVRRLHDFLRKNVDDFSEYAKYVAEYLKKK